ncbi:hypothetical protein BC832DRAFT_524962, partial [Gaertneriomyces semiglobifer]
PSSDGSQIKTGACSSTPMGAIPSTDNMISAMILNPANAASHPSDSDLEVIVAYTNLDTGFFSDPQTTYYLKPQTLNSEGKIQGHTHISVQKLNVESGTPPDPKVFGFFKGLNGKAVDGKMSVTIPKGTLQEGLWRVCTMTSAESHQPVVMPVAQRGSQDDCV